MTVTIYHNARCSTSRNTLELIRNGGAEPHIIDYLAAPPDKESLRALIQQAGLQVLDVVRTKEEVFATLGLEGAGDEALLDAMVAHPVLIQRPLVVTPLGVRLCRPSDKVLEILPPAAS